MKVVLLSCMSFHAWWVPVNCFSLWRHILVSLFRFCSCWSQLAAALMTVSPRTIKVHFMQLWVKIIWRQHSCWLKQVRYTYTLYIDYTSVFCIYIYIILVWIKILKKLLCQWQPKKFFGWHQHNGFFIIFKIMTLNYYKWGDDDILYNNRNCCSLRFEPKCLFSYGILWMIGFPVWMDQCKIDVSQSFRWVSARKT